MLPSVERAYRVLGLTPGAPKETVHRAYRDLAQVWHPDRFANNERLQEKAGNNLRRINEAYEVLRDYEPPEQTSSGVYARLSETFSAVLGLGDILKTSEVRQARRRTKAEPEERSRRAKRGTGQPRRAPTARRRTHRTPRARPEHPSGRPASTPPPVVGVDTEDGPVQERNSQPVAIWLVLFLSLLLVVAAILFL